MTSTTSSVIVVWCANIGIFLTIIFMFNAFSLSRPKPVMFLPKMTDQQFKRNEKDLLHTIRKDIEFGGQLRQKTTFWQLCFDFVTKTDQKLIEKDATYFQRVYTILQYAEDAEQSNSKKLIDISSAIAERKLLKKKNDVFDWLEKNVNWEETQRNLFGQRKSNTHRIIKFLVDMAIFGFPKPICVMNDDTKISWQDMCNFAKNDTGQFEEIGEQILSNFLLRFGMNSAAIKSTPGLELLTNWLRYQVADLKKSTIYTQKKPANLSHEIQKYLQRLQSYVNIA